MGLASDPAGSPGAALADGAAVSILESLASALRHIDSDSAAVFAQFVDSCLVGPQAKQMWRDLMTAVQYFRRHPLAEQVREEGRIQERQEMTLHVLEWRGIPVPDGVRERVHACTDPGQLEVWAQRALHAADAAELSVMHPRTSSVMSPRVAETHMSTDTQEGLGASADGPRTPGTRTLLAD
ncbi:hypothetical protein GCM10010360_58950 [Streptomyces nogalater]